MFLLLFWHDGGGVLWCVEVYVVGDVLDVLVEGVDFVSKYSDVIFGGFGGGQDDFEYLFDIFVCVFHS